MDIMELTLKRAMSLDVALFYVVPELDKMAQVEIIKSFDDTKYIVSDQIINPSRVDKYHRTVQYTDLFKLKPLAQNEYTPKTNVFVKKPIGDTTG